MSALAWSLSSSQTAYHATVLFVLVFALLVYVKPSCFYLPDHSLRRFGVGYRQKTMFPLWLAAIVLAILAYTVAQRWWP